MRISDSLSNSVRAIADRDTATVGACQNADIPYRFGTIDAFMAVRRARLLP